MTAVRLEVFVGRTLKGIVEIIGEENYSKVVKGNFLPLGNYKYTLNELRELVDRKAKNCYRNAKVYEK